MLTNLLKAAVGIVALPVDATVDLIAGTDALMGGHCRKSLIAKRVAGILSNLDEATKP